MPGEDGKTGGSGKGKGHHDHQDGCEGDPFASLIGCSLASNLLLLVLSCYVLCKGSMLMQMAGKRYCKGSAVGRNVVLPIIESIPNAVLVLVSGIMTLPDTSTEHVAVGVGTMAGSSVLLLTLCWGAAVFGGRTELSLDGVMIAKLLREPFDLTQTGVSTDHSAPKAASIMLASAALYLIIEVPSMLKIRHLRWLLAVTSLFCTIVFVVYCSHQVIAPISARKADIERRLRHLRYNTVRSISYYANRYGGILLPESQEPNVSAIERMFQRFDRDHDGLLNREELCALLVAFEFCRPTPAQGAPVPPLSRTPSQPTTPVVPTNPLSRSSVGGLTTSAQGLSGLELEQMQTQLSLTPEQQQAEQQQRQFHARYGHVEHIADYWLRQWGGLRTGGVTLEAFVKNLLEWFAEKERRFVVDFPNAKPPKAVRRSGQTKFWVYTFKSPDDYQELLLQHKAKLDAAAAAAAAAQQAAQLGGTQSGVKGLILSWSKKRKNSHEDLKEPLLLPHPEQDVHRTDNEPSVGKQSVQQPHVVQITASSEQRAVEGGPAPSGRAGGAASPDTVTEKGKAAGAAAASTAAAAAQKEGGEQLAGSSAGTAAASSSAQPAADGGITLAPPAASGSGAGRPDGTIRAAAATAQPEGSREVGASREAGGSREIVTANGKHVPHVTLDVLPHAGSVIQEAEGGRTRASSSPTSSVAGAESTDFLAWEEEELTGLSGKAEWESVLCVLLFAAGLALCITFAGPFTRTTGYVSSQVGVYPFLVAFLAGPLASHAPGIYSSVRLAATQQPQNVSVALSQIYGAVTMINTLVLGVLLGVMAVQHIKWRYTGELIITLAPTLLIGAVGASSRTIYSVWGVVALCMFPAAVFLCWLVRAKLV